MSKFLSRPVIVGAIPKLPVNGVSMVLGNELDDRKAIVRPREIDKPGIFPTSAVARVPKRTRFN